MSSKKKSQQSHARSSFEDRYGIVLTQELHNQFVKQIQTGQATFLFSQSHRVSIFSVRHEEKRIPVVYDGSRKVLVTALPEACNNPANVGVFLEHLQV